MHPSSDASLANNKRVRLLLVEDNEDDWVLFNHALRRGELTRFEVTRVRSLKELQGQLTTSAPDVILLDLHLPDCGGFETCLRGRAAAPEVPIIILTGLGDEQIAHKALQEGAQDYLVKGEFTGQTLSRAVRYAIERKQTERRLIEAQRMDAIAQLAAAVAHDFNNILTVIAARSALVADQVQAVPDAITSVQEVQDAVQRAANLTWQLLTFSRQQPMHFTAVDLNTVVRDFGRLLKRVLPENISLEFDLLDGLAPVMADAGMIQQVLFNLVVNARNAMPNGGGVRVATRSVSAELEAELRQSVSTDESFVQLSVTENGSRIAPQVFQHNFEPLFATKDAAKGTGLGLAAIQRIVLEHRGVCRVTNTGGSGAAFDIFLPIAHSERRRTHVVSANSPPKARRATILLVEDEPPVRAVIGMVLRAQGHTVHEAGSADEAIPIWRERAGDIDVLLTDMIMPGAIKARDLAISLQAEKPSVRVIFMSGYSPEFTSDLSLIEGENFLQKPFAIERLLSMIGPIAAER